MTFAQRVKEIKKEQGLSSDELSRRSGVPVSTLSKLLAGNIEEPKLSVALALARALGCSLGYLADGTGVAQATTMTAEEQELIRCCRMLDSHGRELVSMVAAHEFERCSAESAEELDAVEEDTVTDGARVLDLPQEAVKRIPLYLQPVSAGRGAILDAEGAESIAVPARLKNADYALRVSGNSMEPRFRDGDLVLVNREAIVPHGELGIFVGDGEGYFKRYMGDCLRSLNPAYGDIPIGAFRTFSCCGRVIGHLKRTARGV